jgi:hypothetical protein
MSTKEWTSFTIDALRRDVQDTIDARANERGWNRSTYISALVQLHSAAQRLAPYFKVIDDTLLDAGLEQQPTTTTSGTEC